jgi:hypothetical protein
MKNVVNLWFKPKFILTKLSTNSCQKTQTTLFKYVDILKICAQTGLGIWLKNLNS